MRHRNDLMLLRIAQGDAYAMAREYVKAVDFPEHVAECLKLERYLAHPSYHKLPPGTYTDDTQMSIAMAEYLIDAQCGCVLFPESMTHEGFIQRWFDTFKRDQRDGYSRGFQKLLEEAKSADELRLTLRADSTKNGAAMRSVPLGIIHNIDDLKAIAGLQASTTHATHEGITSSVAVALMSHYALYDRRDFPSMTGWMANHLPTCERFCEPWVGPVQSKCQHSPFDVGMNTAWAVHTLLTTQTTLIGTMKQVLKWGGDTDSVAAIAWGIGSARWREDIPAFFETDLEKLNGSSYGPEFLKSLGKRLMETST
jgi:ADP-ribosyl-[dinitrogen reductase] hydrolase